MSKPRAIPANPDPEYADEVLCPDLAAMRALYGLLVACRKNRGERTCWTFRGLDSKRFGRVLETAAKEGFNVEDDGLGSDGRAVIVVSWRGPR